MNLNSVLGLPVSPGSPRLQLVFYLGGGGGDLGLYHREVEIEMVSVKCQVLTCLSQ